MWWKILTGVLIFFILLGAVDFANRKRQMKSRFKENQSEYKTYFESQKKIWFKKQNALYKIPNVDLSESIDIFPFFTNFTSTTNYLEKTSSLTRTKDGMIHLNKTQEMFEKVFLEAENKLIYDFNNLNFAINQQTVEYLSRYYTVFLDQAKELTKQCLYDNVILMYINSIKDNKTLDTKRVKDILKFYEQNMSQIESNVIHRIYDDVQNQYRDAFESFFRNFEQGQQNNGRNYYQSINEEKTELDEAYKTLGVDQNVSDDDLKRAYKKLAIKYHPDRNKDSNAKEIMMKINSAYTLIKKIRNIK